METKNIVICLFTTSVIFLFGCKKGTVDNTQTTNPTTENVNANFISKSYMLSNRVQNSNALDTTKWIYYTYDNLKRVALIKENYSYFGQAGSATSSNKTYFYNGNDSLPSSINFIELKNNDTGKDTISSYFTYNSFGQKIVDSTIKISANISGVNLLYKKIKSIKTSTYVGNKIYIFTTSTPLQLINLNFTAFTERDTATLDSKGNIIEYKNRRYNNLGQNDSYSILTYTFDNNPSPFSKFSPGDASQDLNKNNVLRKIEYIPATSPTNPPQTYEINRTGGYTYNLFGYPTISNFYALYNAGFTYKEVFVYTSL